MTFEGEARHEPEPSVPKDRRLASYEPRMTRVLPERSNRLPLGAAQIRSPHAAASLPHGPIVVASPLPERSESARPSRLQAALFHVKRKNISSFYDKWQNIHVFDSITRFRIQIKRSAVLNTLASSMDL